VALRAFCCVKLSKKFLLLICVFDIMITYTPFPSTFPPIPHKRLFSG
jgi:hypothetical protein